VRITAIHGIRLAAIAAAFLSAGALAGCAKESDAKPNTAASNTTTDEFPKVLAKIGDEQLTLDDVRGRVGDQMDRMEAEYRRQRSRLVEMAVDTLLRERVLLSEAKRQGKSLDDLVAAEAGGSEPSEIEVAAWYKDNQVRLGGRSLDELRPQIIDYLKGQRQREAAQKLEARLRKEKRVEVYFQPYRLAFNNTGAPTSGKEGSPVTLVEFSDFQCPFCHSFLPTLKQIQKNYGDRIQIVYRQYPIPSLHPFAMKAAEASLCANEQGKFWEMHDAMFNDQKKLAVSDLKQTAERLGMNRGKFDKCLDSGRYVEQVQNDVNEGARSGVTGTPALFVNGVIVDGGAVPYETVAAIIDRELTRSGGSK
jgi:protein-disulfide isomerase